MAKNKKKLIDIDPRHRAWIKQTAHELKLYEKDVIHQVFEHAMQNNVMAMFKQKAVTNELERTLAQLSGKAKEVAALQERSERLMKEVEGRDGK